MKRKISFPKTVSLIIIPVIVFAFTILLHHVSMETVGNHLFDSILTVQFSDDLPSAIAQDESPTPTPTPSPVPTSTLTPTPSPTVTPTPTPTPTLSPNTPQNTTTVPTVIISENGVLKLLFVVLLGVLVLIFTLLSPAAGIRLSFKNDQSYQEENLAEKAKFLTETFPKLLEGVTVVLIVMVVTVLTLAGFVKEQGTISILSALIGYVLGRKASELEYKKPPNQGGDNGGTEDSNPPDSDQ